MRKRSVAHLTTVHPRGDTRILFRQVRALVEQDSWHVRLVVADGNGSGWLDVAGIPILIQDTGRTSGGRIGRAILGGWRAFRFIRREGVDTVHFHDPELIPVGMLLKLLGCVVIYDVHEDVPRQVLHKYWLPEVLRYPAAWLVSVLERISGRLFDGIVAATPSIASRFPASKAITVQNFPIRSEMEVAVAVPYPERASAFVYVGAIAEIRGAREMVRAAGILSDPEARLDLAGQFNPRTLIAELKMLPGWKRVTYHGWASRAEVAKLLGDARAGLVVLHPTQNYPDAYPVKMFEYMAAGLPVIASDFPLWRQIVQHAECGILVEPMNPQAIADAMLWILEHPVEAQEMGQRGRNAVTNAYNWETESDKLIGLYERLLPKT